MLIDFFQKKDSVELSYIDENGLIKVEEIFMQPDSSNGFFDIVVTDDTDPDKIEGLKSFYDNPVKKIPAKSFEKMNINEFLSETIKDIKPELHKYVINSFQPKLFSFDIETEINKEFGYSTPEKVENKILSIAVSDENLDTILFIIKNDEYEIKDNLTLIDRSYVENILSETLGQYYYTGGINQKDQISFEIKVFDDEYSMLTTFIECINKYFHILFGWNSYYYDWPYIMNRCIKLGIDVTKASPVRGLSKEKRSVNEALEVPIKYPRHRLLLDYMKIVKCSKVYSNLDSHSLNNVAGIILGLQKVTYSGNLNTLYNDDYLRFIAYALVDSIITMLIHKHSNLVSTYFFQSYYTSIPYLKLNQNPISMALIYKHLRNHGKFMATSEYTNNTFREYEGAYVKAPVKNFAKALIGLDFKSLYPNSMISYYLSPESKIDDTIAMKNGEPLNSYNKEKYDNYISKGYCITPYGRIYKRDQDNLVTSIEKSLLSERSIYKKYKADIYQRILPIIEKEIKNRGINV